MPTQSASKRSINDDIDRVTRVLSKNANKSFVDRIVNREKYPELDNGDGTVSTHSMAWGESDGKYFVYPTVLQSKDGSLKRYSNDDAWNHTQRTGNFIEFNSPDEADWFSKNYKKVWR